MVWYRLVWVKAVLLILPLVIGFPVAAQTSGWLPVDSSAHLFPTKMEDCRFERMPSFGPHESAKSAYAQCKPSAVYKWIAACGYPGPKSCAALEGQVCSLRSAINDEQRACTERLREHNAEIAKERRRLAEEQRMQDDLARQREREARQARDMSREALARGDVEGANRILDTFIDQQDPTQLSRDILSGSNNLRRILGLPQRPVDRLSGQITALSLDAYRDLTGSALAQLGDAAGGGAFSVDDGSTRANGADALPRGDAFPDPGAALIQTENGFADIAANWDEMSTFGQLASMASILVAMAAVAESDGRPIPPSLVDGTFAANVTALAEAAAGGNFRFGDEVDAYTARADIVEEEITLQRVAANARAEEKAAAEAAARQAELKRVEEEGKRLSEEIARWIAEPPKQIGIKPSASDTNFLPILRGVDANRCVTLYRPPYSSPVENTLLRTLTGSAMRDVIQINAYFVNTCDRKVSCEVTSIVSKISGEILTQRINFDDYSLTSGYRRHIIGIAPQDFIDYGSCRF